MMDAHFSPFPERFLRAPEAGRVLGLSGRTLEKHRTYGAGPSDRKIAGQVVYAVADLQDSAERGRRASTSDVTVERLAPARPPSRMRGAQR